MHYYRMHKIDTFQWKKALVTVLFPCIPWTEDKLSNCRHKEMKKREQKEVEGALISTCCHHQFSSAQTFPQS